MSKKILITFSFIAVFCLAVLVWYSPVLFKGYNLGTGGSDVLVKAKNYAQTGIYASEDNLSIILSSELISEAGQKSFSGNKLTGILYSYIIKLTKISNNSSIVLANCIILALALLFFSVTVYYLFNFKIFLIFSLIYIFLPTHWISPQPVIGYGFGLLFLSLFFLFFSIGTQKFIKQRDKIKKIKFWSNGTQLILSGIFLILTCLSKEPFLLLLPILFFFLIFLKLKKYLYYIFIPIIIIFLIFWLPDFVFGKNTNLNLLTTNTDKKSLSTDLGSYAHLFPDPYTYHFNKEEFLQKTNKEIRTSDLMQTIGTQKNLTNLGFYSPNIWKRFKIGTSLLLRHIFRFFSITEIGGPLIFFLFFLGLYVLKKQTNYWFKFYLSWIIGSILLMSYLALLTRNHLMDFGWAIAISVAWGIVLLSDLLSDKLRAGKNKTFITILLLLLVIYNLVLCGHVMWGQVYDNSSIPLLTAYANKINTLDIKNNDVIAVPFRTGDAYNLNFNTDKSVIIFKDATIVELLSQEKLSQAFDKFKVKYILGYEPELSQQIIEKTQAQIIADSSIPIKQEDLNINNKNWFMNLVK